MPRTMIGVDSTGAGCIKIMKVNTDNPRTTADTARSKFLYNSKLEQAQVSDVELQDLLASTGNVFTPSGSTNATFTKKTETDDSFGRGTRYYYRKSHFPNNFYNMPLFDYKSKRESDGKFQQHVVQRRYSGKYYQDNGGYYSTLFGSPHGSGMRWFKDYVVAGLGTINYGTTSYVQNRDPDDYNPFNMIASRLVLWNLPGDSSAILSPPTTPTAGKKAVKITSAALKIAKPGYDVDTATASQLAFDSSRRPAKIIAAADVSLPTGDSFYETGITLPDNVVADVSFYSGTTIRYPSTFGAVYWFDGTKIRFTNGTGSAGRARFMIYLEDDSAPSSGSNKVLREFNDGTVDVVQFLRPGSATTPRFSDIVIDSRWPAVQLMDEGYFTVANGQLQTDIVVPNTSGMFLMVKYCTVHGAGSDWSASIKLPFIKKFVLNYSSANHAGDSTYADIVGSTVTFNTFKGAPGDYYNDGDNPGTMVTESVPDPIIGIRYYIFGIPS